MKAQNIVEEHNKQIEVTYDFPKNKIYVEPAMVIAGFFLLFLVSSVLQRGSKKSADKAKTA
jgi:hypothetical protein